MGTIGEPIRGSAPRARALSEEPLTVPELRPWLHGPTHDHRACEPAEDRIEALDLLEGALASASPREVLASGVQFCSRTLDLPAAGWLCEERLDRLAFTTSDGLSAARAKTLRRAWAHLSPRRGLSPDQCRTTEAALARSLSAGRVIAYRGDTASIAVVGGTGQTRRFVARVGYLIEDALQRLRTVALAQARHERLEAALAWTAHELVAPIVAARAAVDSILGGADDLSQARELLVRIERELDHSATTSKALLRWAAGAATLDLAPIDLSRVIGEAVDSQQLDLDPDIHPIITSFTAPVMVMGDTAQLRSAASNLIRNAVSYSPAGSEVSVAVEDQGHLATVTVKDEGPGVSEAEQESLFDPFARGHVGEVTRAGHGLGLYIARRVMEAHDGALWIESKDRGAAFKMQLPTVQRGPR